MDVPSALVHNASALLSVLICFMCTRRAEHARLPARGKHKRLRGAQLPAVAVMMTRSRVPVSQQLLLVSVKHTTPSYV